MDVVFSYHEGLTLTSGGVILSVFFTFFSLISVWWSGASESLAGARLFGRILLSTVVDVAGADSVGLASFVATGPFTALDLGLSTSAFLLLKRL